MFWRHDRTSWLYPGRACSFSPPIGSGPRSASSLPAEDFDEPAAKRGQAGEAEQTIWCFDLRTHDQAKSYLTEIAQIVNRIVSPGDVAAAAGANGHIKTVDEATRQRWYPVIDYGRCENCLECLNFCLFGVFGLDAENRVVAEQPTPAGRAARRAAGFARRGPSCSRTP